MASELILDGGSLTPAHVVEVARGKRRVQLGPAAAARMQRSRAVVESHLADGQAHYGINTGFGSLSRKRVSGGDLAELQRNLVRSHAAGVGPDLPEDTVRAMMLLLAASLARGLSGVRPVVAERLIAMLNDGLTPRVPEIGSVGASGDLAPLAHVAMTLIGEGEFLRVGSGMAPLALEAKEGLALINGTHLMAAQGALLVHDFDRLFDAAVVACAMMIDACKGTDAFLDPRVYHARNQPGPALVAARLRDLLAGSTTIPSHREDDPRVQDPYSLRCAAPVLGAAWDLAGYVKSAVAGELGAVTDNPLVFSEGDPPIVSAGNFHGMPIAIPLDTLSLAISHIAGISERRTFYLLAATDSENPIPAYLSPQPGLHSGLMIAQYTAAACCNEIQGLCTPASVANIPTSAGMEDYNSFGPRAAAKARRALDLARSVVAAELLCASEALEYHRPLRSGGGVERAHAAIRARIPRLSQDRPPAPDINSISRLIEAGAFSAG
jgi:histidine ammonia-lyase